MSLHSLSIPVSAVGMAALLFTAACSAPRSGTTADGAVNDSASRVPAPTREAAGVRIAPPPTPTPGAEAATLVVYKTPTCGCCEKWVEHMQHDGFTVVVHDMDDVTSVKDESGVPGAYRSCHTAIIGKYVVEGHVPASDVRRLLRERPQVAGIAVAGMPAGSPGMEGPSPERYDVMTFGGKSPSKVFASH